MSSKHQAFYIIILHHFTWCSRWCVCCCSSCCRCWLLNDFFLEHLRLVVRIKLLGLQAGRVTRKIGRRESPDHLLTKAGFATQEVGHIMS